ASLDLDYSRQFVVGLADILLDILKIAAGANWSEAPHPARRITATLHGLLGIRSRTDHRHHHSLRSEVQGRLEMIERIARQPDDRNARAASHRDQNGP